MKKIVILIRSDENNGINVLANTLNKADPEKFILKRSIFSFTKYLYKNKKYLKGIFLLSDVDFMVGAYISRLLKLSCPLMLGVYHPKQWLVSTDSHYSSIRAKVFKKILDLLPGKNIISSSPSTIDKCRKISPKIGNEPTIIPGPCLFSGDIIKRENKGELDIRPFKIVTVGRFVDFKIQGNLRMMEIVDKLNRQGYDITFDIYGDGPCYDLLRQKLTGLNTDKISIKPAFENNLFASIVTKYNCFFGMGCAVVQAAALGVPSLIAIQYDESGNTYGLFSDYNHTLIPMFGDVTEEYPAKNIEDELIFLLNKDKEEINKIGDDCYAATMPFSLNIIVDKIQKAMDEALPVKYKVAAYHLIAIRLQTYFSRVIGKKQIHA